MCQCRMATQCVAILIKMVILNPGGPLWNPDGMGL
jgi:hypothetical protein